MKAEFQQRLILVSNRLPYQLQEKNNKISLTQSDGGLVTTLKSYFENEEDKDEFNEKLWIGSADFPEKRWKKYFNRQSDQSYFKIEPLFIEKRIYNKYYN